jgi:hypothetical protein
MFSSRSKRLAGIFAQISPLVAAALWVQCGGTPTGTDSVAATVTVSAPSHLLRTLGDTLALTATVRNQAGAIVSAASVQWLSLAPEVATVNDGVVTATKNGSAQIVAVSGTASGHATVTVQQVLKTLVKASADTQAGIFRQALPQPVTVIARDSGGHPAADVKVGFSVVTGAGSVAVDSVPTDAFGHAADTWILGNTLGTQKLIVGVSVPSTADTFFATGADGLDSLPQTLATIQAAVDLMTTGQINVYGSCSANPAVNCANGSPGLPIPLALTRDSLSIVPGSPGIYNFAARVSVVSTMDIPFTYSGVACTMGLNTTPGTSPTIRVTGTATFGRQLPGDSINRIDITNVSTSGVENVDLSLQGGIGCLLGNTPALNLAYQVLNQAFADAAPHSCGAPGPALLEPCPPPPSPASARQADR